MRTQLMPGARANLFPHLPPGREPGAQSLRNRIGFPLWEWLAGLVGAGMLISGVFVAAGGRGPEFDRSEEAWGGILFAAFGLLCVGWAYAQRRARRTPRLLDRLREADLAVDRDEARRGETLAVTLTLTDPTAAGEERLEVGLVCTERYDHLVRAQHRGVVTHVRQTAEATAHEEWQEIDPAAGEHSLTFQIPGDAPCSYEGDCVSYAWRASARVVRRLRSDPRTDRPIWVRT